MPSESNYDPQRRLLWSAKNYFGPLGVPCLERQLQIRAQLVPFQWTGYTDNGQTGACYTRLSWIQRIWSPEIKERLNNSRRTSSLESHMCQVQIVLKFNRKCTSKWCKTAPVIEKILLSCHKGAFIREVPHLKLFTVLYAHMMVTMFTWPLMMLTWCSHDAHNVHMTSHDVDMMLTWWSHDGHNVHMTSHDMMLTWRSQRSHDLSWCWHDAHIIVASHDLTWLMIHSTLILQCSSCSHNAHMCSQAKCSQYWPSDTSSSIHGSIKVQLKHSVVLPDYTIRNLTVELVSHLSPELFKLSLLAKWDPSSTLLPS